MKLFENGKNNWLLKTGDLEVSLDISDSKGCCPFTKAVIKGAEYISNDSSLTDRVLNIFDQHKYTKFDDYLIYKESEKIDDYESEKHKEALNNIISLFDGDIKSYIKDCIILDINYHYSQNSVWSIFVSSFNKNVAPFLLPLNMDFVSSNREISIIFCSDIVDSTLYADKNDALYEKIQIENRKLHKEVFEKYNATPIKEMGDGNLVTFNSIENAIRASKYLLAKLTELNGYKLRIGIHIGLIRKEENDIQGLHVNKTYRIQSEAEPNSCFISEEVYQNIRSLPEFKTTFIGAKTLKGISGEHNVYRVDIDETVNNSNFRFPATQINYKEYELILIKEAVLSERCNIIKVRHQQGLVIQVDEKVLFRGDNPRKMAEWEGVFEKLLSDNLIIKKGNQSFTLSSKGFEIGDKLVIKNEYGIKYDARDNAFISITKVDFFLRRIQDAFPGVRKITWFNDQKDIIDRLEILLRWPLEFYPISKYGKISLFDVPEKPIWWFRGGSKNEIGTFKKLVSDKCLLDSKELKVSNLAVCPNANDKKSFIYLQIHGEESVFSRNSNISNRETEEYAIFDGHIITREEYDDGSALINGKIISTSGRAEPRYRHLKPYNFILSSNSSDFISNDYNQHLRNFLDSMLLADNIEEIFEDKLESLLELNIISDYYGPE